MVLPKRKSEKLEISILQFKENLSEYKSNHHSISEKILNLTSIFLQSEGSEKIKLLKSIEELNYEMVNEVLLNLENIFESIGGLELNLLDVDSYLLSVKDEQDLLKDLEISAKNLVKTVTVKEETLSSQELNNLNYLYDSYKKVASNTQQNLNQICEELEMIFQKVRKMEKI